jgi:GH25 family lysozyme M1 (1,4-beta-N-acetylmuramidase)
MTKKLIALILTVVMSVSFSTAAFAAETGAPALTLNITSLALKAEERAVLTVSDIGVAMQDVRWSSSNPSVASVNGGLVTAAALGRATVTATASDGRSVSCAVHVVLKGIDVSQYQGTVDWAGIKAGGVDFAILRTGYGNELPETQTDTLFSANYDAATANGIKLGAYHVSYALTPEIAVQEAQMCLSILNKRHLDYPIYIDIEHPSQRALPNDQIAAIASAFCSTIVKAGYKTGIYSSTDFFNGNLSGSALDPYDKWVAHPDAASPNYSGAYTMWQYSHTGTASGINGSVDLNYSYRDYAASVPAPVQLPADTSLLSDTGAALALKAGQSYVFKFTPNRISQQPVFTTGNASVIKVSALKKKNGSYYLTVKGVGSGSTSVYSTLPNQKPVRRCVVTVTK